ncbi:helix-turn-helix transcriptional regulator [Lactobacillus terrae]|uniref:helix-turn-helix transcriptional regulator n=1 Tax=Lactobacillus terrae TaxID=2269374 RepID=UPI000C1B70CB|nr:helix-turn-helix domain-containing protein [Lactobacillus terrae]
MDKIEIMLSDTQLEYLRKQIFKLISEEIDTIRNQTFKKNRYLNKKQTCSYLNVTNNTLDKWIKQGLPKIELNNSIRFDVFAIDKWMNDIAKIS